MEAPVHSQIFCDSSLEVFLQLWNWLNIKYNISITQILEVKTVYFILNFSKCLELVHTFGKDTQKFGICVGNTLDQGGLVTGGKVTLKTEWGEKVRNQQ